MHQTPVRPLILLVDDYEEALEVWALYWSSFGFEVLTAPDGPTAIELATTRHPDLIVLDIELPGKSGVEVAAELKASPGTRDIPIIAATGSFYFQQLAAASRSGFDAVVPKPCEPAALLAKARSLLERRPAYLGARAIGGAPAIGE